MADILECFGKVPNLRPMVALINLGLNVEDNTEDGVIEFCGQTFNLLRAEPDDGNDTFIEEKLTNIVTEFCRFD